MTKEEYFKLCTALVQTTGVHLGHCIIFCYALGWPPDMAEDAVQHFFKSNQSIGVIHCNILDKRGHTLFILKAILFFFFFWGEPNSP